VRYDAVLPSPPKSPSQIPMLSSAPVPLITDFNETLIRFRDKLSKSIENRLGVQIKPGRTTCQKSYPSHF
jgi:hypothetical protein